MKNISCCFTGHREINPEDVPFVAEKLSEEILKCIENGIRRFYAGGAIGFDTLAARCVLALKEEYPDTELHIIMPCENQTRGWSEENKAAHSDILSKADEIKCLSDNYYTGCMQARNRYMVENSSVCISYLTKTAGGSAYTVNYARKSGLEIINIADYFQASN